MLLAAFAIAGPLLHLFGTPGMTVTLVPRTQSEQGNYQISAVTGRPDPANHQIQARLLSSTSPTQSATGAISGTAHARQATGTLTFINEATGPITLQGTTITGKNGVAIHFDGPVTVSPFTTTVNVPAVAVNAGAAGNIPAFDLDGPCCASGIIVKNPLAFSGGQDAHGIQQSDIDRLAQPLITAQQPGAQANLQGQVKSNERVVDGSLHCQPNVHPDHPAGTVAVSLTVTVSVTCQQEVYDYQQARTLVAGLLQAKATSDPNAGASYTLTGSVTLTILSATVANAGGQVNLNTQAQGQFVYHFSQAHLRQLAAQIAGKSEANARALLLQQPGILDVQFSATGDLPANADEVHMLVK